jgi:hypothetical protein
VEPADAASHTVTDVEPAGQDGADGAGFVAEGGAAGDHRCREGFLSHDSARAA